MTRLPALVSRITALVLLTILVISVWWLILRPLLLTWATRHDESWDQSIALLAGYLRIGANEHALQGSLAQLQEKLASQAGYFSGGDINVAAAALQTNVKRLVEGANGEVRTLQILPPSSVDGFRRVAIHVEFLADNDDLQKIFYDIETTTPAMFLDTINIQGGDSPILDASAGRNSKLTVRCDVSGFLRPS